MMRKEYFEMLLDVIKTATKENPIHKAVAALDCHLMVTDAKRALRITTEEPTVPDGLYQIAKVGKSYQLVTSQESGRYPDVDRIMRLNSTTAVDMPCTVTTRGITARLDPGYFPARLLTIFGRLQTNIAAEELTTINYVFLSVVAKKMFALANDSIRVEYIGPRQPLKISCMCMRDNIEYVIMPLSF